MTKVCLHGRSFRAASPEINGYAADARSRRTRYNRGRLILQVQDGVYSLDHAQAEH
jgi:hypothetical protein